VVAFSLIGNVLWGGNGIDLAPFLDSGD
jgi:hypothetical protein